MCSRTRLDLELAIASRSFILLAIERNRNRVAEDLHISVDLKIPREARSAELKALYVGVLHKCCDSFFVHGLLDGYRDKAHLGALQIVKTKMLSQR